MSKFYVNIVEDSSEKVIERFDAYDDRDAMRLKRGIEINLNHDKYSVVIVENEDES